MFLIHIFYSYYYGFNSISFYILFFEYGLSLYFRKYIYMNVISMILL